MRLAASHNVSGMRTNENAQQGESHCQATKLPTYIKKGHKANFEQSVCCSAKQFRQKHLTRHMKHHIQHKFNIVLIDSHATMPWWYPVNNRPSMPHFQSVCWLLLVFCCDHRCTTIFYFYYYKVQALTVVDCSPYAMVSVWFKAWTNDAVRRKWVHWCLKILQTFTFVHRYVHYYMNLIIHDTLHLCTVSLLDKISTIYLLANNTPPGVITLWSGVQNVTK